MFLIIIFLYFWPKLIASFYLFKPFYPVLFFTSVKLLESFHIYAVSVFYVSLNIITIWVQYIYAHDTTEQASNSITNNPPILSFIWPLTLKINPYSALQPSWDTLCLVMKTYQWQNEGFERKKREWKKLGRNSFTVSHSTRQEVSNGTTLPSCPAQGSQATVRLTHSRTHSASIVKCKSQIRLW